ncbi:hypothetical protein RHGRI_033334 [Rhododendron griersonianum]|uniref:Bifunctional inhibitor/plant lipid transfer protein/seed storage helical domain-containing protein n=1 Tax=Rhododendron griersonianum TaxID=479676 RepID=A0AAV6I1V5_9ERIC|nr:hypothetical protein RHGRI_033334 [Rhododendron griersonianum]
MEAAASQKAAVLVFGLLLVLIIQACNAQICNVPIGDLMACRHAVRVTRLRSGPPPPTAKCCEVISRADLRCLCSHKNSKFLPVLGVDPGARSLIHPSARGTGDYVYSGICGVQVP